MILIAGASAVIVTAWRYPGESATYPMVIGAGVAGLGGWILLRELLRRRQGQATAGHFAEHGPRLAIGLAALVALFRSPSARSASSCRASRLASCFPPASASRRWGLSLTVAVISVVSILLIFVLALERPIPTDILSPLGRLLPMIDALLHAIPLGLRADEHPGDDHRRGGRA